MEGTKPWGVLNIWKNKPWNVLERFFIFIQLISISLLCLYAINAFLIVIILLVINAQHKKGSVAVHSITPRKSRTVFDLKKGYSYSAGNLSSKMFFRFTIFKPCWTRLAESGFYVIGLAYLSLYVHHSSVTCHYQTGCMHTGKSGKIISNSPKVWKVREIGYNVMLGQGKPWKIFCPNIWFES